MEKLLLNFARVINSDRYQYTESDVFLEEEMETQVATFDMFFRKTEDNGFAVVSGVREVIDLVKIINITSEEEKRKYFSKIIEEEKLLEFLVKLKFTGEIYGMRDGEIAYPNEPVLTIKAPLIQAKILETPILNIMNLQMAVSTKASRVTRAAGDVPVLSFGSRRAHGFDSALAGNKAAIIGGCSSHSNLVTEYFYDVPSVGTMAHSYVQSFGVGREAEKKAFDKFIKVRRKRKSNTLVLLIDTYNTLKIGIKNAIEVFKENEVDDNYDGVYGIRIDSGDLAYLSKKCRQELDNAGMKKAKIILTNGLNESLIRSLRNQGACVDQYGVGDTIATSKSNPCFGGVYKIAEIDENPVIKLSEDVIKISNPGHKEVYRIYGENKKAEADLISLTKDDKDRDLLLNDETITVRDEEFEFKRTTFKKGKYTYKKLTREYVIKGEITKEYDTLMNVMESQKYYKESLKLVAEERQRLDNPHKYKVDLSKKLRDLKYGLIEKITEQIEYDLS